MPDEVSQLTGSLVTPVGFLMLGARAVPSRKTQTAAVLSVLLLIFHGMVWGTVLFSGWYEAPSVIYQSFALILGVVGTVLGLFLVYIQERRSFQVGTAAERGS